MAKTNPIQQLQEAVDDLNQVLRGGSGETVDIDGVTKPTLSAIAAEYVYNHGIQPDVATGLANVGEGGVFTVPSSGDDLLVMYRVIDGEADEIGRAPSASIADDVAQLMGLLRPGLAGSDIAFEIKDGFNRLAMLLTRDGLLRVVELLAKESVGTKYGQLKNNEFASGALVVQDDNGTPVLALRRDGTLHAIDVEAQGRIGTKNIGLEDLVADQGAGEKSVLAVTANGSLRDVLFYIDDESTAHFRDINVNGQVLAEFVTDISGKLERESWLYGMVHLCAYGQSQMVSTGGQPPIHSADNPYALMFSGGIWNNVQDDSAPDFYDAVPLRERALANYGETTASQFTYSLAEDFPEAGSTFQVFATNSANGGKRADQLMEGGAYWPQLMTALEKVYEYAQAQGYPYSMPMFFYWQGGSDESAGTDFATWQANVTSIWQGVKDKVEALTGTADDVPMMLFQTTNWKYYGNGTGDVGKAQLWFAETYDNCYCMPVYWATNTDAVHHDNVTYSRCGAYQEIFLRESVNPEFDGVRPLEWSKQGRVLTIRFSVGYGPLQFWGGPEAAPISEVENYGFTAANSAGGALNVVSARIVGRDRVAITIDRDWLATDVIQYAVTDNGDGGRARIGGQRGWLFDKNGERDSVTLLGDEYPLHIPCVQFEKEVG